MKKVLPLLIIYFITSLTIVHAQTESDGIRMSKKNFCVGLTYSYSSWTDYWEGTNKRNNENLGKVSSSTTAIMGNYGYSDRLNVIFSLPYIKTKASAGTLEPQKGFQDISLSLKWLALNKKLCHGDLSIYTVIGGSTPSHNYVADFLPLAIGLKSRTLNLRLIGDYHIKNFFLTVTGDYIFRNNIEIDRNSYYTDHLIYSNEVYMPNVFSSKIGLGFRKGDMIFEGIIDSWNTLGGFDIRKNDMPFPSNEMDMVRAGINLKVPIKMVNGLSLIGNAFYTLSGRNVGQSTTGTIGAFYILDFNPKTKTTSTPSK